MVADSKVWFGMTERGDKIFLEPKMANRHGLVAGATGTGKTVTLKVLAESFSDLGVPVFMADVKGDVAGLSEPGLDSENMQERIARFGLSAYNFAYRGYPVALWDIFGQKGMPLRTTISEMGPLLLARLMDLNDLQSDILSVVFKIADDNGLLLIDTKDLKAMLNYVSENHKEFEAEYGKMSPQSIAAIVRALVALEIAGGETFFGEPALDVTDWFTVNPEGKGVINILDSSSLINNGTMYSTFLLWLLSELFERLPEVGDLDKPKMVFFFDEAHLLFNGASKVLLEKVEQVVKLIRSKGVGVYFCTQNPKDIPDGVLAQLGNKIEHALHAYTPNDQKAVKAAAMSFRENPELNTYDTILNLGTGEAVVSCLQPDGVPSMVEKVKILPPQSKMASIDDASRTTLIQANLLYSKYAQSHDPDSAYEFLARRGLEIAQQERQEALQLEAQKAEELKQKEEAKAREQLEKEKAKAELAAIKAEMKGQEKREKEAERARQKAYAQAAKEAEAADRKRKQAIQSVGNSVAGTVGRELGKQAGKNFGAFGKRLGGNLGASLGRGLLSTLLK